MGMSERFRGEVLTTSLGDYVAIHPIPDPEKTRYALQGIHCQGTFDEFVRKVPESTVAVVDFRAAPIFSSDTLRSETSGGRMSYPMNYSGVAVYRLIVEERKNK